MSPSFGCFRTAVHRCPAFWSMRRASGRSSISVDAFRNRPIGFRLTSSRGVSAVLADPRWVAGAVALFTAARAAGIPTVLDADVADREVFEMLLPLTDHAIFSEPALAGFAGSAGDESLAKIAAFGCRVAAVTCGHQGLALRESGVTRNQPAYPVDAVDTTGAGDVFHGAYALAIGVGLAVIDAMAFAAAAAALKCTRPGGRAGIPTLEDCLAFQRTCR
jgi:sulfofructose kinase